MKYMNFNDVPLEKTEICVVSENELVPGTSDKYRDTKMIAIFDTYDEAKAFVLNMLPSDKEHAVSIQKHFRATFIDADGNKENGRKLYPANSVERFIGGNMPASCKSGTKKRDDYISWDEYFMGIALLSAMRSKDPNTQVGACIVSEDKKIIGVGYNGLPKGCSDEEFPWNRNDKDWKNNKYPYICHAELNAILNSTSLPALKGATLYVSLFPCNECAKAIIQTGIKHVVYLQNKYKDSDEVFASQKIFDYAGVTTTQLEPKENTIVLEYKN